MPGKVRRRKIDILPAMTRECIAHSSTDTEHTTEAVLDPGASVSLISQRLAVKLQLKPIQSDLPTLAWVYNERKLTYGAYALHTRMKDDHGTQRLMDFVAYGVDKEGPEILLGNHTLHKFGVQMDLGKQKWKFGLQGPEDIELIDANELDPAQPVGFLGLVHRTVEAIPERILSAGVDQEPRLPGSLREYEDVFATDKASILPYHKSSDHKIELFEGKEPPYGPLYNLSERELRILREYIEESLANGRIRYSNSPAGAPILFVPKKDGSLRLCVDYRGLNAVTIKDRCALPLINETLDRLSGARYYTTLDLKDAYYRLRIRAGDEWKTAFRTRYGHFEYLVMPFGMANAPATFQAYINKALAGLLDTICVVYLDDILIYTHSDAIEVHWRATRAVLARLRDHDLYAKLSKCTFAAKEVEFLGFIINTEGVSADPLRISTIKDWPVPSTVKELQVFLGFANFYRRFVAQYAKITAPLTDLLKASTTFSWSFESQSAFDELKERFSDAPVMRHFDPSLLIRVETDASQFAIAGILSQLFEDQWHPVAFVSRKLQPAERNWEVYDQELLAIVYAFKSWRHYLEGAQHTTQVYTDHNNLRGIRDIQKLNPRQARWAMFLSGFDFDMFHRPGAKNPADGPSRRPDYFTENTQVHVLLPTLQAKLAIVQNARVEAESGASGSTTEEISEIAGETPADRICNAAMPNPVAGATGCIQCVPRSTARVLLNETADSDPGSFSDMIVQAQQRDTFASSRIAAVSRDNRKRRGGKSCAWRLDENGVLRYNGRIYIPPEESIRQEIMLSVHDHPMAGHFGADRTHEVLARNYYWQNSTNDVKEYVKTCAVCQRSKAPRHLPYGQLTSLPLPSKPFEELTMDFITALPPVMRDSCVYDAILVIVDRYTKMARYIPARKDWTAKDLAEHFFRLVCCTNWGVPKGIVSDRGPTFISSFWGELCFQLQVQRRLSTAFHPQTDGQTERQNQTLEHYLRCFCSEDVERWLELLPIAEFAYNNSVHSSTKQTPFFILQGQHPHIPEAPEDVRLGGEVPAEAERLQRMREARSSLEKQVKQAQEYQQRYYNKKHLAITFKKGDIVLLSAKNLRLIQPSKKMTPKYVGPFKVRSTVGTQAYRLWLPTAYRIHDVFHVSLLKPYHHRPSEPEADSQAPDILSDGEEVWEVEKILMDRTKQGQKEYLLKWKGYSDKWNNWVSASDFEDMSDLLHEYESRARKVV